MRASKLVCVLPLAFLCIGADNCVESNGLRSHLHRLQEENKPSAIKHIYVVSEHSGKVLVYSTVRGMVYADTEPMSHFYWWDTKGVYHDHYATRGAIVHISSEPMTFPKELRQ